MHILFPLILSLPIYTLLDRTNLFSRLNRLERLVLTLAGSVSLVNIVLAYVGQFSPIGIKIPFLIIFLLCLMSVLISFKPLTEDVLLIAKKILRGRSRLLTIFFLVLLTKVTIFYILHPVIDPDVVSQYLTFARSIVLSDHTPPLNAFTLSPSATPPVGGSVLLSFYYVIAGSTQGEGFLLYTYPFFLGLLTLTYLISKKLFNNHTSALLSVVVFLSIPLVDSLLLEWALYPDVISVFLQLTAVYFLLFKDRSTLGKDIYVIDIVLGLSIAESILLKSQGVLFLAMLTVMVLIKGRIFNFRTYILGVVAVAILFFVPILNLFGSHFFRSGENNLITSLLIAIPPLVVFVLARKFKKPALEIKVKSVLLIGSLTFVGFLWLARNYVLYKSFLSVGDVNIYKDIIFQHRIFLNGIAENLSIKDSQAFNASAIFTLPIFGSLFLIPKLVGIFGAIRNSSYWNTAVLITLFWYALVIIYSGFPNERYLLIILPFLSMLAVLGVKQLIARLFKNTSPEKTDLFCLTVIGVYALLSLSQSALLTWGFGSLAFSPSEIRGMVYSISQNPSAVSDSGNTQFGQNMLISTIRLLNIRLGAFSQKDVVPATLLFGTLSLIILACIIAVLRFVSIKNIRRIMSLSAILLMLSYITFILLVSGFSVTSFPKRLEKSLYNYWGAANIIVPYLEEQEDKSSIILAVGPQTGLSYKLNMKVYNIEYDYGFIKILPVINESDRKVLHRFFVDNNIEYVLVYEGRDNYKYLVNFDNNSQLYGFIKDDKFFTTVIFPDQDNLWRLYKLNR
jgi:hypothetical protein